MNSLPSCRHGTAVAASTATARPMTVTGLRVTKRITGLYIQVSRRFRGFADSARMRPRIRYPMSTGTRVIIGERWTAGDVSDDALAFLVAHELAHNILKHRLRREGPRGERPSSKDVEREADRLAPWLMARAGFDARELAAQTFNFIYTERTQTLNWPVWGLYLIMPVFALSMTIHSAANLLEDLGLVPRARQAAFLGSSMQGVG